MSNDKKTRVMTVKGFLHKASGKISAVAFLQAHRAWLETGDLSEVASPILRMLDEKQILPSPALELLSRAILAHHLRTEAEAAERKLLESTDPSSHSSKTWDVTCYDAKGNIVTRVNTKGETVEIQESFALQQRASEWCDRRLAHDCNSECFGVIVHIPTGREVVIMRGDALARVFPKTKSPFSKKVGTRDNKLSFGVSAKQDRAHFSHG